MDLKTKALRLVTEAADFAEALLRNAGQQPHLVEAAEPAIYKAHYYLQFARELGLLDPEQEEDWRQRLGIPPSDARSQLDDLAARQRLIIETLSLLSEQAAPDLQSFALLALQTGLTAAELDTLEHLFTWAIRQEYAGKLTREAFVVEFESRLPQRKRMLEPIMRAYQAEGKYPGLCQLILS